MRWNRIDRRRSFFSFSFLYSFHRLGKDVLAQVLSTLSSFISDRSAAADDEDSSSSSSSSSSPSPSPAASVWAAHAVATVLEFQAGGEGEATGDELSSFIKPLQNWRGLPNFLSATDEDSRGVFTRVLLRSCARSWVAG